MLKEIDDLINSLQKDGHIAENMTQKEVIRLVYGLMMAGNRASVTNTLSMWQRCSFVRRQLAGVLGSPDCAETLSMLKKGGMVEQMAVHFKISSSHAYTVCSTCIEIFKAETKIK